MHTMSVGPIEGAVKFWHDGPGWGIVEFPDRPDAFVHHTAILMDGYRTLDRGQRVRLTVTQTPKGWQAEMVEPL